MKTRRAKPAAISSIEPPPPSCRRSRHSMGLLEEVGGHLVRLRTQAGLDPDAAAAAAQISVDRLADAEAGIAALTEDELGAIARAYGVDTTEIFGGRITPFQNYAGG